MKSPCHPDTQLIIRKRSKRAGIPILLLSCPVCDEKYQATDSEFSHPYQCKKKSEFETKSVKVNGRMKKSDYEKLIRKYETFQKFLDFIQVM